MGRPLKIQKYGTNQGIITTGTAAAVPVDEGFPQFSSLTDATYPVTMTADNFFGVVGGAPNLSQPSATFPEVSCTVNIALPSGTGQGSTTGRIIRQKGAHKYLVVSNGTNVQDEDMVVGGSYMIASLDTTDWQQMGAPAGAGVGTIFTCTALCASPQNGYGYLVGQCVLTSVSPVTAGNMIITYNVGSDSTQIPVSRLTNKFVQDWSRFQDQSGNALTSYADTGNNVGPVVYSGEDTYVANFFTDEATTQKSGADTATAGTGTVATGGTFFDTAGDTPLAQVENVTV